VGEGSGWIDLGLKISLHVVRANRNGDGVTVRRGCFGGVVNKFPSPAAAGEGGDAADNRFVNDFLGDAILLNFRPCKGAASFSMSTSIIVARVLQNRGNTFQRQDPRYLRHAVSVSASGQILCDRFTRAYPGTASVLREP
jgi:hypothetical protein